MKWKRQRLKEKTRCNKKRKRTPGILPEQLQEELNRNAEGGQKRDDLVLLSLSA